MQELILILPINNSRKTLRALEICIAFVNTQWPMTEYTQGGGFRERCPQLTWWRKLDSCPRAWADRLALALACLYCRPGAVAPNKLSIVWNLAQLESPLCKCRYHCATFSYRELVIQYRKFNTFCSFNRTHTLTHSGDNKSHFFDVFKHSSDSNITSF